MKLVLRACAAPLRPAHLAYFLKDHAGTGMSLEELPHMDQVYHDVAGEALSIEVADDQNFANAVKNLVFPATRKPIAKLGMRNQFLALAPTLKFGTILADIAGQAIRGPGMNAAWTKEGTHYVRAEEMEAALGDLIPRPFVMTFDMYQRLEAARLAGGSAFSPAKLQGYVEQHAGAACVFSYDG